MYPGVGPDGVYRLHAGLYKSNRALEEQLTQGGNRLQQPILPGEQERRTKKLQQIFAGVPITVGVNWWQGMR